MSGTGLRVDEMQGEVPPPYVPPPGPPPRLDRRERILEALGDAAARRILLMLNDAPHSAQELLAANHIPQSTLYRKIHELRELGLVGIQTTVLTPDAKRVDLFRSLVEELHIEMKGNLLDLQVRYRDLAAERLKSMWGAVRREAGRP
jgi:DNA-binding transcriptional ArsR family regulator